MKTYPCVIVWVDGVTVTTYPILVQANDPEDAQRQGIKIGDKLRPRHVTQQGVNVGRLEIITETNAKLMNGYD